MGRAWFLMSADFAIGTQLNMPKRRTKEPAQQEDI